jgi:hypothetical protein
MQNIIGYYVDIKNNKVQFTLWIDKDTFAIDLNVKLKGFIKKEMDQYYGDIVNPIPDFSGDVVLRSDTITLHTISGKLFTLKIIDSLMMKVIGTSLITFKYDTLYRISSHKDILVKMQDLCINALQDIWIFTFYKDKSSYPCFGYSDIEDSILLPINPMWNFFDTNNRVIRQSMDSLQLHPLTRKFSGYLLNQGFNK